MKPTLLIACAALLLTVSGCGKKAEWQEFSSPGGKYSVLMPGKPNHKQGQANAGLTIEADSAVFSGGEFGVAYAEMPPLPPGTPPNYKGAIDNQKNGNGGTVTKEADWDFEGAKGKEVEMKVTKPRDGYSSVRMIILNNRLYQVMALGPNATLDNPDVKKFFDSFKVTK